MKRAVVFDNSGTLIERYRVIKDVINGNIFTDINSLDLIDQADALALVVLQFNTNKKVTLKINGKTYTAKTNDKGQATFSLKITKKGKFTAVINFAGDNTYNAATKKVKITIR